MRHGARSRHAVETRAQSVRTEVNELLAKHLQHVGPADTPLVDVAVDVITKLRLISDYLDRVSGGSLIDLRGKPRPSAELYLRLHRQALAVFDRLGVGPQARAAIVASLGGSNGKTGLIWQIAQQRRELEEASRQR
jgi:hypothetical protein